MMDRADRADQDGREGDRSTTDANTKMTRVEKSYREKTHVFSLVFNLSFLLFP